MTDSFLRELDAPPSATKAARGDCFVGRSTELEIAAQVLTRSGTIKPGGRLVVLGERRMGKSSFLARIEDTLLPDADISWIQLDTGNLDQRPAEKLAAASHQIVQYWERQPGDRHAPIVFALDDVDLLLARMGLTADEQAEAMLHLGRVLDDLIQVNPIAVVLAATPRWYRSLPPGVTDGWAYALMPPFAREETAELLRRPYAGLLYWPEELIGEFQDFCGGYPYLATLLAGELISWMNACLQHLPLLRPMAVCAEDLAHAELSLLGNTAFNTHWNWMFEHQLSIVETEALRTLAKGQPLEPSLSNAIAELVARGFLRPTGQGPLFMSQALRMWCAQSKRVRPARAATSALDAARMLLLSEVPIPGPERVFLEMLVEARQREGLSPLGRGMVTPTAALKGLGMEASQPMDAILTGIRRRLGDDPGDPRYVEECEGIGYRLRT